MNGEQEQMFTASWEICFHEKAQQKAMEVPRISLHRHFFSAHVSLQAGRSQEQGTFGLNTSHQILAKISSMFFL